MSGHGIPERGLMAEVITLRAELDAARRGLEESQREWSDAKEEVEELSRDLAARVEQVDPDKDVWQYLDGLSTETDDTARAERTEPATGEDVEVVAQVIEDRLRDLGDEGRDQEGTSDGSLWIESPSAAADDLAACILAALDLPRRERALREQLSAATKAHDELQTIASRCIAERDAARLESDTWWKRSEAQVNALAEMEAERDEAFTRLLNEGELADANAEEAGRLVAERDAANAALANTARLLEEARAENERLKTVIRIHVGGSMAYHVNECADCEPELSNARQHATAERGLMAEEPEMSLNEYIAGGYAEHPLPERGLGARYVAVRHSASFFESRAKSWRRWALLGWAWGFVATTLAILVVIFR